MHHRVIDAYLLMISSLGDEASSKFDALQRPDRCQSPGLGFDMMARDDNVADRVEASVAKTPLRTYSRRGRLTKRSYSNLPEDLPDFSIKADSNGARLRGAQPGLPKRQRRRNTTPSRKTPTEVFWEQLSSSAPIYTRALEMDQLELGICTTREENVAAIEKPAHSVENDDYLPAKHNNQNPSLSLSQRVHNEFSELMLAQISRQNSIRSENLDNDEGQNLRCHFCSSIGLHIPTDYPQPRLPNNQGPALIALSRSKLREPLGLALSRSPKTKRARRTIDVDTSLSVVQVSATKETPFNNMPTALRKNSDHQSFRKLEFPKGARVKHSSDGFEREEARTVVLGRKRRMDSIDHDIGSLELTQNRAPVKKIDGPTWARGQNKNQVCTVTRPWNKTQHFANSTLQIDFEEDVEPIQSKQSNSDGQAPRGLYKRHISQLISDDDEEEDDDDDDGDELMYLAVPSVATEKESTPSGAGIETARTTRAKHSKRFPHTSDATEPVILLTSPGDNEDEPTYNSDGDESVILLIRPRESENDAALATIPRTGTPEQGQDIEEAVCQLPPKEWMLNVLDYERDALALRPDSKEWTREVEIPTHLHESREAR